jgi:hypothetical protein
MLFLLEIEGFVTEKDVIFGKLTNMYVDNRINHIKRDLKNICVVGANNNDRAV